MLTNTDVHHRQILKDIAHQAMLERGLVPDWSAAELAELSAMPGPAIPDRIRDLRNDLWCSIDNADSLDLDQLTAAKTMPNGRTRVMVAIADVDAMVKKGSVLDAHAGLNTCTVYTAAEIFPMLPTKLSTGLTSLNQGADRMAIVVDMVMDADGKIQQSELYRAWVRNQAKLAYAGLGDWLDAKGPLPNGISAIAGLEAGLRLQDVAAGRLQANRHQQGALDFQTIQSHPVFQGNTLVDLQPDTPNRANRLIEEFMIAANAASAQFLTAQKIPSLRRVVRVPKHWAGIVDLAAASHVSLPPEPDSIALARFLATSKTADPRHFPDLSLSIIKLLGSGEYMVQVPGQTVPGHFGLAVKDYAHATAPNRRYPDLITQRLLKAALAGAPSPYSRAELSQIALDCTGKEDAARKVERHVAKSAAAILLQGRNGVQFTAIVSGASDKGCWVRLLQPPVEGRLEGDLAGVRLGQTLQVELVNTDVRRGFVDFKPIN